MKIEQKKIKRIVDVVLGTRINSWYWRFRHFIDPQWAQSYLSEGSLHHPHRKFLIDIILKYRPIGSLLEIGCASGPNLFLLSKELSGARLEGIDISKSAINVGAQFFREREIENVVLKQGGFNTLSQIESKSFDIVISDASLIYATPQQVNNVLREMIRIANKKIILMEQNTGGPSFYDMHWIHNYKKELSRLGINEALFSEIPSYFWNGNEKWKKYGCVIIIETEDYKIPNTA